MKTAFTGFLVLVCAAALGAQAEETLHSYERIFIRSGLAAKADVLRDAATDDSAAEFYGPLCDFALRFAVDNAGLFWRDPDMINVVVLALKGVEETRYQPASETLIQVFLCYEDNVIRYPVLKTLPLLVEGDLAAFFRRLLLNGDPVKKLAAFNMFLTAGNPDVRERGEMAEAALEAGLAYQENGERGEIRELRAAAAKVIGETAWVRALTLVLMYYNRSMASYRSDPSYKEDLIASIDCLSALGSVSAAQTLSLQLGLYHSQADSLNDDDRDLVLSTVRALGRLGYKASSDVLRQAVTLPYTEEIQIAAQDSLSRLKW
ncbi:MAG: hypothetical protein LBG84_07095 [Treponema sp.]|jgi:hypothetical protein|nr:hypothetical protein [Treponema sp.]